MRTSSENADIESGMPLRFFAAAVAPSVKPSVVLPGPEVGRINPPPPLLLMGGKIGAQHDGHGATFTMPVMTPYRLHPQLPQKKKAAAHVPMRCSSMSNTSDSVSR
jgi:hypothetical protein